MRFYIFMTTTISVIHPSKGRPEQAEATIKKWLARAKHPQDIQYILSVDMSDENRHKYSTIARELGINYSVADVKNYVGGANQGALLARGNIFVVNADDFDCPENWDELLLNATEGKEDFLLKTWDGQEPWILTLPIMDRKFYDRFGYIYFLEFKHMFCDTDLTHRGQILGRVIDSKIFFEHQHYSTGKTPKDAINEANDKTWDEGKKLYLDRLKENFGLPIPDFEVNIADHHKDWLKGQI